MGCLKSIVGLLLVLVIAWFAYLNRDRIGGVIDRMRQGSERTTAVASAELAEQADRKLTDLKNGRVRMIALTEPELQSLLQYKYQALLPAFVDSPHVEIKGDRLHVRARVPIDRLPQLSELGEAAAFLPDTTELSVAGRLLPLSDGRVALTVEQVRAARIPLPQRLVPGALQKLGRRDEPGLPPDALAMPLPPGANAAYVRGDSLFFLLTSR